MFTRKSTKENLGIITEWNVDADTARKIIKGLKTDGVTRGSWEYVNVICPLTQAIKTGSEVAVFYTEGMTTGSIANKLYGILGYESELVTN